MTDVEIEQYNNAFVTAFFGLEKELAANSKKSKRINLPAADPNQLTIFKKL